jgi:hypothetical protein
MDTFEIKRDVVFDDPVEWIIIDEAGLATLKANAAKQKDKDTKAGLVQQADWLEAERKRVKDMIKSVTVTVKKPTPERRAAIQAACRDREGRYQPEQLPSESLKQLITAWTLEAPLTAENIVNGTMPTCLFDAVYGEIYSRMFPSEARLAFLS